MQQEEEPSGRSRVIGLVVGVLLILGILSGGNIVALAYWSTPEVIGYNLFTIAALATGGYLIYRGVK